MNPLRLDLDVLGSRTTLLTDTPAVVEAVRGTLGAFEHRGDGERPGGAGGRSAGAIELPLAGSHVTVDEAAALVFRAILDRIDGFFVLHAAALERDGRCVLVSGPSGAGKTTLALALVARGFRLLSDDFAPLARATGLVHPFHKAIGLRPGAGVALAGLDGDLDGRVELAPGHLTEARLAREPARPAAIVLFSGAAGPPDPHATWRLAITVAGPAGPLATALAGVPGVRALAVEGDVVRLEVRPGDGSGLRVEEVLGTHGERIVEYGIVAPDDPVRPDEPRISRLAPSTALMLLARELQNRRPGAALWRSVGGDPLRLVSELAALLAGVPTCWLVPSDPEKTAAAIEALID